MATEDVRRLVWIESLFDLPRYITPRVAFLGFWIAALPEGTLGTWFTPSGTIKVTQRLDENTSESWPGALASPPVRTFMWETLQAHPNDDGWEVILISSALKDPLHVVSVSAHELAHAANRRMVGPESAWERVADDGAERVLQSLLGRELASQVSPLTGLDAQPSLSAEAGEWLERTAETKDVPTRVLRNQVEQYRAEDAARKLSGVAEVLAKLRERHGGKPRPAISFSPMPGYTDFFDGQTELTDGMPT